MTIKTNRWSCVQKGVFSTDICIGEPDWDEEQLSGISSRWGKCKLNPEECGRCMPLSECIDLNADFFNKHNIIETIMPIDPTGTIGKQTKKPKTQKSKKEIKEEDPNAPRQAGMF